MPLSFRRVGIACRESSRHCKRATLNPMRISVLIFLALTTGHCVNVVLGQMPTLGGTCPVRNPAQPIDMRKLTGQWYEVEATPLMAEWSFKCISIKIAPFFEEKSQIKIEAIFDGSDSAQVKQILLINANISHNTNGKDGKLTMSIVPGSNVTSFVVDSYIQDIQVLDTDNTNWAIVWSCREYKNANARAELLWILSRQRTLNTKQYSAIKASLTNFNLENVQTFNTVQTGCTKQDNEADDTGKDN